MIQSMIPKGASEPNNDSINEGEFEKRIMKRGEKDNRVRPVVCRQALTCKLPVWHWQPP